MLLISKVAVVVVSMIFVLAAVAYMAVTLDETFFRTLLCLTWNLFIIYNLNSS